MSKHGYWLYHSRILNESGQGASDISWRITPAPGDVFEFLYGAVQNHDTASRTLNARLEDGTGAQIISQLINGLSLGAGGIAPFPGNTVTDAGPGVRYILVNPANLIVILSSVADAQDADFGMVARCTTVPAVLTAGAGAETVDQVVNRLL